MRWGLPARGPDSYSPAKGATHQARRRSGSISDANSLPGGQRLSYSALDAEFPGLDGAADIACANDFPDGVQQRPVGGDMRNPQDVHVAVGLLAFQESASD